MRSLCLSGIVNPFVPATARDAARMNALVHVASLPTDEGFIGFNSAAVAAQLQKRTALHSLADSVEHEPCSLLSDTQRAGTLAGANAVLCSADEPDSREPLFQAERRVFEDGSHLGCELPLRVAALALPFLLRRQIGHILAATARALNAVWPAMRRHVSQTILSVCEVNDGILECLRFSHTSIIGNLT